MKQTVEIDFKESVKIDVEGFTGWDKERPHHICLNVNIGNLQINGLVEEDAEFLYHRLDAELHDETYEKLEIKYYKALAEIDELKGEVTNLSSDIDYLENEVEY